MFRLMFDMEGFRVICLFANHECFIVRVLGRLIVLLVTVPQLSFIPAMKSTVRRIINRC